ncbi:MAG: hypothetical protein KatS3mg031_0425 [Chitinophagales bacterium]|nr:MAG: hypothetical protein KatS3mg031_0425 [Chitinophagales bacterium]
MIRSQSTVFYALLLLGWMASCDLKPCENYPCKHGTPLEDYKDCVCNCDFGWSGEDCSIQDPCAGVLCYPNSKCVEGACVCLSNYDPADSCKSFLRDRFLQLHDVQYDTSYWSASDTCSGMPYLYVAKIKPASLQTDLEIFGLRATNPSVSIQARVSQQGSTVIYRQISSVTVINAVEFSSLEGVLSDNRQSVRVSYRAGISNCTGVWQRMP